LRELQVERRVQLKRKVADLIVRRRPRAVPGRRVVGAPGKRLTQTDLRLEVRVVEAREASRQGARRLLRLQLSRERRRQSGGAVPKWRNATVRSPQKRTRRRARSPPRL